MLLVSVSEKEQGNLLNEEIKLNHNSAGPKQEILNICKDLFRLTWENAG